MTIENILLTGSLLLVAAVVLGRSSYRTGLPLLLVFLLVGMAFGTDGLGIQFSDMHTTQTIGMAALCVILFSGGMGTRVSAIKPVLLPGLMLSTAGVVLTAFITGLFIWWLSGMEWTNIHFAFLPSLLLAATMSSTDSASVFGILGSQKVGLRHNLRPMLELESGSNDPMAYMLTILLVEAIMIPGDLSSGMIALQLLMQFGIGGIFGIVGGFGAIRLMRFYTRLGRNSDKGEDPGQTTAMLSILLIGAVFFIYSSTVLLDGNGYLAVYLAGITIGNSRVGYLRGITKMMDGLTWLAQIVVFLMLGLLVNPHEMLSVAVVSILIGVFLILIGRPVSVFLSLLPVRKVNFRSKLFVSWVGLRGAVPIIFATYPVVAGVPGSSQIFNIVFFVTLLSLSLQGTTVISVARRLRLADMPQSDPDEFGVELADELPTSLHTITLKEEDLSDGATLGQMRLSPGSLVMMIRRGKKYIVPNGSRKLYPGDTLLVIREDENHAEV
ncbi:MAG: potassium/proton antiporter [Muribaculaceae bacterium]|nr:potassium/proton antiporter [Muribaculaceae bacterium]